MIQPQPLGASPKAQPIADEIQLGRPPLEFVAMVPRDALGRDSPGRFCSRFLHGRHPLTKMSCDLNPTIPSSTRTRGAPFY
jgi:hypothetical protein